MKTYRVTESTLINAPARKVYAILADYHNGHPHILPKRYFSDVVVEEGGIGAGTRIRFKMSALGKTETFRAAITELVPGRTLVETDLESGTVTTFTVLPLEDDHGCHVTISTELKAREGAFGLLEQSMTSMFLRRVYEQELRLLAEFADGKATKR